MSMIGKTLGNFTLEAEIGKGGMGKVYRAKDQKLGRDVAIKVLPEEFAKDADRVARFQREAKLLASLNHPNIAAIYGLEESAGTQFLVLELVEGDTLADRIRADPIPVEETMKLALQIAEALEAAHEKGVIHRDLKPANVMITSKGHAKVMDFGLAKQSSLPGGIDSQNETLSEITLAGAIIGTPNYMSPEQLRGHPADVRSDLYAFGLVYYEMLTGFHPFKQLPSSEIPSAIFADTLKPRLKSRQRIPKQIQNILSKLLVKDPAQRYQSAQELHLALREVSRDERTGIAGLRFLRPIWKIIALIVFILVITPMIWWLWDNYFLSPQTALAFQERDWILIASFQNQTDEAIFNNSLITPFTIGLEQSSYANVYPESRVVEVLKRMKKTETQNIDASIAQEIALREGIKALVIPSIIGIGDNYRLTASIRDPISSIDVMVESVEAKGKEKILDALDKLIRKIRSDLGESMGVITQTSKPLARATTSSIKALSLYTEAARKINFETRNKEAEVLLKEALEVDPHFTYAKAALGMLQITKLQKQQEGVKLLTEAARNVEDLTENEKLMVLAFHAAYVEQDFENAARYEKALVTLHPDLSSPHNNLGLSYMKLGRYEEAIAEFKEAVRIDPNLLLANQNLAIIYLHRLGYLNSAVEICQHMIASNPQSLWSHNYLGWAYLGMDDFSRAQAAFEEELELQPNSTLILWRLAHVHRQRGHYQEAIAFLERILEINPSDQYANYNLGIIYKHLGENKMALKHFEIYRRYIEKKIQEDPADGRGYIDLALTLAQLGEKKRSISLGQKAMAMPPCNATEPFNGEIDRWGDLINLCEFDYAKLLSVQGRRQEALDTLELAVRRGYRNYIFMKIHPDFQNLHDEPRFKELMKDVLHQK